MRSDRQHKKPHQKPKNQPHKSNKQKKQNTKQQQTMAVKHNNVDFDIIDISQSKLCQEEWQVFEEFPLGTDTALFHATAKSD